MTARVTGAKVESFYTDADSGVRVTRLQAQSAYNDRSLPVRITRVQAQSIYNDRTLPVRITKLFAQVWYSTDEVVPPPEPLPPLPQPADLPNIRVELPDRELNPYRPTLPEEVRSLDPVLYDFMAESSSITREQHNKTQAGDSTFPWELLAKIGPEQQFTLGSLGRFYHDDFGIILARYCRFAKMKDGAWVNGPVGRLNTSKTVDWTVTNDPEFSNPDSVVGILGSYVIPSDGWYGWVLTQGANHFALRLPAGVSPSRNQALVWHSFETVAPSGLGTIVARAYGAGARVNSGENRLDPGTAFIQLEGPSVDSLWALLGDKFAEFADQINSIQSALDNADFVNLIPQLRRLLQTVTEHELRISKLEQAGFQRQLDALVRRLEGIQNPQALYERIMGEVNPQFEELRAKLLAVVVRLNAIPDWTGRFEAIEEALLLLQSGGTRTLIPVVDGGIPPELVYLPSGELVFVEIER